MGVGLLPNGGIAQQNCRLGCACRTKACENDPRSTTTDAESAVEIGGTPAREAASATLRVVQDAQNGRMESTHHGYRF